jgi:hypothetical protein
MRSLTDLVAWCDVRARRFWDRRHAERSQKSENLGYNCTEPAQCQNDTSFSANRKSDFTCRCGYIVRLAVSHSGPAMASPINQNKEFYLGLSASGRKSCRDVKHYRRRKRWLA